MTLHGTSTTGYALGTRLTQRWPWGLYVTGRVLCPDGKVRAVSRISDTADTFFSIPAAVRAHGKTVSGYVTITTMSGSSIPDDSDPLVARFIPYEYGVNANVFTPTEETPGQPVR